MRQISVFSLALILLAGASNSSASELVDLDRFRNQGARAVTSELPRVAKPTRLFFQEVLFSLSGNRFQDRARLALVSESTVRVGPQVYHPAYILRADGSLRVDLLQWDSRQNTFHVFERSAGFHMKSNRKRALKQLMESAVTQYPNIELNVLSNLGMVTYIQKEGQPLADFVEFSRLVVSLDLVDRRKTQNMIFPQDVALDAQVFEAPAREIPWSQRDPLDFDSLRVLPEKLRQKGYEVPVLKVVVPGILRPPSNCAPLFN